MGWRNIILDDTSQPEPTGSGRDNADRGDIVVDSLDWSDIV